MAQLTFECFLERPKIAIDHGDGGGGGGELLVFMHCFGGIRTNLAD